MTWIWIGAGVWLLLFVVVQKMMRNVYKNEWPNLRWGKGDTLVGIGFGIVGIVSVPVILIRSGKSCFKKGNKK